MKAKKTQSKAIFVTIPEAMKWFLSFVLLLSIFYFLPSIYQVRATYDPLSVPNNKFGIHIISADTNEASEAADLVNPNGDWGYVTFLIEDKDRDVNRWQQFFNDLRRRHLIPLVRIATHSTNGFWARPNEGEENGWAEFLNNLIWPTKNRYVIIFNEPNHGLEWGNSVDVKDYAQTLDKYIKALKFKSPDFFVLNAGLDTSAPQKLPAYQDEADFLRQMNQEVPGIFDQLDGWVSHSYPQPDFSGPATGFGRGSIKTWQWEQDFLRSLGVKKTLPVFITETGWKHAEGTNYKSAYLSSDAVALSYKRAFLESWNDPKIVAVTPFLLNYQDDPFEHFSFKKPTGEKQKNKLISNQVLGEEFPQFYPQYQILRDLVKTFGQPIQETKADIKESNFYNTIAVGEQYLIYIKVKNLGQSIWGEKGQVKLSPIQGGTDLGMEEAILPEGIKIEPGQEYTFSLRVKPPNLGEFKGALAMFENGKQFAGEPFYFITEVKSPVILNIKSKLAWKDSSAGEYILNFLSGMTQTAQKIILGSDGSISKLELHNLLPDNDYDFTLSRPYYQPKTIHQKVISGENTLNFGELQPDIPSAILNPPQLWQLLPLSN